MADGGTGRAPGDEITVGELPVRPGLRGGHFYRAPQPSAPVRLNTNESPYPMAPELVDDVLAAVRSAVGGLHRYPDRDAWALREHLAEYLGRRTGVGLHARNVWAANGSLEILQQLFSLFGGPNRRALGFAPQYDMYRVIATGAGVEWVVGKRAADLSLDVDYACALIAEMQPDMVLLTNPHSPSGQAMSLADLARILDVATGVVVVDEAYGEFSALPSAVGLLARYPARLVVTRTLSKAFGFAGGRVGYLAAAPAVTELLSGVSLPYHLSTVTQAAACAALRHADATLAAVSEVVAQRERVAAALRAAGMNVFAGQANFLLFGRFADAARAWQRYLDRGVLIRDVGVPHHLRVTIGLPAENDRFLAATAHVSRTELRHA